MLSPYDDFMCHQIARPFQSVEQSDLNWTERVHFPVVSVDGRYIVDVGFGRYPNRDLLDGFGGLAVGSEVYYVRGSRLLDDDLGRVGFGPLSWEVIEGLKTIRCRLEPNEVGIAWDLLYEAGFPPSQEEYHRTVDKGRVVEEQVRFYQMGRATGWLTVNDERIEVTSETFRANRDRSWGVRRTLGPPDPSLPPNPSRRVGGLYSFVYIQFADWGLQHYHTEDAEGATTYHFAQRFRPGTVEALPSLKQAADFDTETFTPLSGSFTYTTADGELIEVSFDYLGTSFPTGALGGYAEYHGFRQARWMGDDWLETGHIDMADPAQRGPTRGLVDHACRVRCGDEVGIAIIECIPSGAYRPYGVGA